VKPESLFVVIRGENHDAHVFLPQVFEAGCMTAIVFDEKQAMAAASEFIAKGHEINLILVKDTVEALGLLAKDYLDSLSVKKIAVTGSTGKTSTKDMVYFACKEKYNTVRTQGNYNNEIGLPLTVLGIDETAEVAIFEMGMDGQGQIHYLAKIVRPEVAIITNVGITHMEKLGSRENIFNAKMEITDFMNEENLLIISDGGDMLNAKTAAGNYRLKTIGFDGRSNFIISDIEDCGADSIAFTLETEFKTQYIKLNVGGRHNAINASLAAAAALDIGVSMEEIVRGLQKLELTDKRLSIKGKNGIKVIDDTYNASPDSMKAGIDVLISTKGVRHVAVLGDMYELGESSEQYHKEVGMYAAQKGVNLVVGIGETAKFIALGAEEADNDANVAYFESKEEFIEKLEEYVGIGDVILVKGSRGMAMEKIVNKILE